MPFDLATAKPLPDSGGFDLSSAKPVSDGSQSFVDQVGSAGRKARSEGAKVFAQVDKGIDYSGVDDAAAQVTYSMLSPEDRTHYLKAKYGADKVGKDSYGRDYIIDPVSGEKKAFARREGPSIAQKGQSGQLENIPSTPHKLGALSSIAQHAGDALPVIGMMIGGILGGAAGTGPGGIGTVPGAVSGSALGGSAGESGNKLIMQGLGLNKQTSGEVASDIGIEGLKGAGAELGGRAIGAFGRSAMGPYAEGSLLGPHGKSAKANWQEHMADVDLARSEGYKVKAGTLAPTAIAAPRIQNFHNYLFGDEQTIVNRGIAEKRMEGMMPPGSAQRPAATKETLSSMVSGKAEVLIKNAEREATIAKEQADSAIKSAQEAITGSIGRPSGNAGQLVSTSIENAHKVFSDNARELYRPIDQAIGKPVFPTQGIKDAVKHLLRDVARTEDGKAVTVSDGFLTWAKDIENLPPTLTAGQVQGLRHLFSTKAEWESLNADLTAGRAKYMASAANRAFDDGVTMLEKSGGTIPVTRAAGKIIGEDGKPLVSAGVDQVSAPMSAEQAKGVVSSLRRADKFYKAGMKRFGDMDVEALVKDATQHGYIEPEKVAKAIATPGQTEKLLRIKKSISADAFKEVGRQRWQDMVQQATDPMTGLVNWRSLARITGPNQMGRSMDVLYGQDAAHIRTLINQGAAHDGKIPSSMLGQGNIEQAIQKSLRATEKLDNMNRADWISAIRRGGRESLNAADYLTAPSKRLELRQAVKTFGPQSPEVQSLKEYTIRQMMLKMEVPATRGGDKLAPTEISGAELVKQANAYGRDYFNEFFGKTWTDDFFKFAKATAIATRKNPGDAGWLSAAVVGLHPLSHLTLLAKTVGLGELMSTESGMTYLSRGMTGEGADLAKLIGSMGTRAALDVGAERIPKKSAEFSRGVASKLQSETQ